MKLALCVESDFDEFVFKELVARVTGQSVEVEETVRAHYRVRGYIHALRVAPKLARMAYREGADCAVFAIDNDGALQHSEHDHGHTGAVPRSLGNAEEYADQGCRHCLLLTSIRVDQLHWRTEPMRWVVAVPVQAIETWLLLAAQYPFKGKVEGVGDTAPGRIQLKQWLYSTADPTISEQVERARQILPILDIDAVASRSASFRCFVDQLRTASVTAPR